METATIEKRAIKTVSFREVHAELLRECDFAINFKSNNNLSDVKAKSEFLTHIGFSNSIATKVYKDLTSGDALPQMYAEKYKGQFLFIYESQLERLVEKYNLYVRPLEFYAGDIPEKNIKEMQKFHFSIDDVTTDRQYQYHNGFTTISLKDVLVKYEERADLVPFQQVSRPIMDYKPFFLRDKIEIAAVKDLFLPKAFEKSQSRIISKQEIDATMQVDTDPIVMLKVPKGRIIITAWGDEANDEILARPALN